MLGPLALLVGYVLDPLLSGVVSVPVRPLGETVLTVLVLVTLLAGVVTAAALRRTRQRVAALRAGLPDQPVTATGWDRVIDRLAPEPVIINTFPRTSVITQLTELTGTQRNWIRIPARAARQLVSEAEPQA